MVARFSSAATFDSSGANAAIAAARIRSRACLSRFAKARSKRLHQNGGAAHRRQRLEQPPALRREFLDPPRKWQRDGDWSGERLDALGLAVGELAIDRFEIVEMMKHDPQRDAGPFGDARCGRAQVAFVEKIEQRIDHRMPRARGSCKATVE